MTFAVKRLLARAALAASLASLVLASIAPPASAAVTLDLVAGGFTRPVFVTFSHAGDARLFVVEQGGLIKIINADGSVRSQPFLDIRSRVATAGSEQGLLGLAFHPGYVSNRLFYVNYTRKSDNATVVVEMRRSATNPNLADASYSRRVLLVPRSSEALNHNGGWTEFRGNLLYVSTGDGGGPPEKRALRTDTLLGKILRVNPLDPDGRGPLRYSVPSTNPYVGRTGLDEIWARGLRNPWRCSFDHVTDRLWCADVGERTWEEINRVPATAAGVNYGWPVMEGRQCFNPPSGCNTSGKLLPIAQYSHAFGCSVTGGYVARRPGAAHAGKYIVGDYCSGNIWTISADHVSGAGLPTPTDTTARISSFGRGSDAKIYLVHHGSGPGTGAVYYVEGT